MLIKNHIQIIEKIISQHIGGEVVNVEPITGGYVGSVYKVQTTKVPRPVVVKMVKLLNSKNSISVDNQVFGSRFFNFQSAYKLLAEAKFPLPKIYAQGKLEDEGIEYVIMDYLEGQDVREVLEDAPGDLTQLHQVVGSTMGRMHCITSPKQGFIGAEVSDVETWKDTFFNSLNNRLQMVIGNEMIKSRFRSITGFIKEMKGEWVAPKAFVLTHGDGLQAIAKLEGDTWIIQGIVDIEDYFYTDQRFALAGHSLALEYERRALPESFWDEYKKQCPVDPSYDALAPVFKLYHLLTWLAVANNSNHVPLEDQLRVKIRIQNMIKCLLNSSNVL